jgi:acetate kinase
MPNLNGKDRYLCSALYSTRFCCIDPNNVEGFQHSVHETNSILIAKKSCQSQKYVTKVGKVVAKLGEYFISPVMYDDDIPHGIESVDYFMFLTL